jgi:glycine hydroxymethyltransferase
VRHNFIGESTVNDLDRIMSLVGRHRQWREKESLNLIPSENVTSPAVRTLLSSELVHRYTSPDKFYMGTRFVDEIEQYGEELAKDIFGADVADLRPLSGHVADLIVLACFTKPNDKAVCVSSADGGYPGISKDGVSDYLRLKILEFPFSKKEMNVKTEEAEDLILREEPRLIVFGASRFLFPHPVRKLAKAAMEVEAQVGYDGSHVLGLIAGKEFQDPLREGASMLFGSTHKSFFGPQGGIILADRERGEIIKSRIYPAFVDNAHWNRIAALALALAEMRKFGKAYARQVVINAQALAEELAGSGLPVACSDLGFTKSHQVFLDYGDYRRGRKVAEKLEEANIIVDCGVRLGVCELTRRGMKKREMQKIASYIKTVINDCEKPRKVRSEVAKFVSDFQQVRYCFE